MGDRHCFATSGLGVHVSADGGTTWEAINEGLTMPFVAELVVSSGQLYAGTDGRGLFVFDPLAALWSPAGGDGMARSHVTGFLGHGELLFACSFGDGVFELVDGQWEPRNTGSTDLKVRDVVMHGGTLYAGTADEGVFESVDGGGTWSPVNDGLTRPQVRALLVFGRELFAGTDRAGLFRATVP